MTTKSSLNGFEGYYRPYMNYLTINYIKIIVIRMN